MTIEEILREKFSIEETDNIMTQIDQERQSFFKDHPLIKLLNQSNYHLEEVLDELKYSRPSWAQLLIHTWQNEIKQQRILRNEDDTFFGSINNDLGE